jgi:hypothetical protein
VPEQCFLAYKKPRKIHILRGFKEATTGFEPVDTGVADHCLTTWLRRHIQLYCSMALSNIMPYSSVFIPEFFSDDSRGNRTPVTAVKGRCLNRLTMEPYWLSQLLLHCQIATGYYDIIFFTHLQAPIQLFSAFFQAFFAAYVTGQEYRSSSA